MREYILACIDNSANAKGVCDAAIFLAKHYSAGITLLHALEISDDECSKQSGDELLAYYKNYCKSAGVSTNTLNLHGDLTDLISTIQKDYFLLILGKLGELELGSKVRLIIKSIDIPVLLANKTFSEIKNVLYAFDGSESLSAALNKSLVSPIVKAMRRSLIYLGSDNAEAVLRSGKAIFDKYSKNIELVNLPERSADALLEYSRSFDLIVMGAYKNKTIKHIIFGSFTNEIISRSELPILILK